MKELVTYLPFLIPVFIIQIGLMVIALINLFKNEKVKILNKPIWILIILFVNLIGPIIYLLFGRDDE